MTRWHICNEWCFWPPESIWHWCQLLFRVGNQEALAIPIFYATNTEIFSKNLYWYSSNTNVSGNLLYRRWYLYRFFFNHKLLNVQIASILAPILILLPTARIWTEHRKINKYELGLVQLLATINWSGKREVPCRQPETIIITNVVVWLHRFLEISPDNLCYRNFITSTGDASSTGHFWYWILESTSQLCT